MDAVEADIEDTSDEGKSALAADARDVGHARGIPVRSPLPGTPGGLRLTDYQRIILLSRVALVPPKFTALRE